MSRRDPPRALGRATGAARGFAWALRTGSQVRAHLHARGMATPPSVPAPPGPVAGRRSAELGLRLSRRTCLERTLVMQAWYAAEGIERDVVVGVKGPTDRFEAHAWLEGEPSEGYRELARYPSAQSSVAPASDPGTPRTTVIITAWDEPYSALLHEAGASVRSQGRPADLVVVDNASKPPLDPPDGATLIRSEKRLSRGEARNLGLREVRTEFVLFLDADDLLLEGVLERSESQLDADPERAACAMSILEGEVGSSESIGRHSVPRAFVPRLSSSTGLFALGCSLWPLFSTQGATLIRTTSISAHAYADADGGEDWALGMSLALRGVRVLSDPGLLYRRHPAASGWVDPPSTGYLPRGAAGVRDRLRSDPATPMWLRAALPLVWLGQTVLLRVLWPLKVRLGSAPGGEGDRQSQD